MAVVSAALMSAIAFVSAAAAMGLLCLRSRMSLWRRSLRMWLRGGARRFHMLLRLRHLAVLHPLLLGLRHGAVFHAGSFHARLWLWLRLPSVLEPRVCAVGLWLRLRLSAILKPWICAVGLWLRLRLSAILKPRVCT